ncbi:MAG: RNA methyltransferase [Bacteroidetes bacterium]|nr:RNA methyltransferase [Bacteroidota bacterium]
MISKNQVKLISSLHQKKFRKEHGLFIAEGEKVCRDLVESDWTIRSVFMTEEFRERKFSGWTKKVSAEIVTEKELEKISALTTPQQILVVGEVSDRKFSSVYLPGNLTLMLDEIKDPGNLGTIVRIADWFGIGTVICSETCADIFNPKTVQATMGSLFRVKVFYQSLKQILEKADEKSISVYGTLLSGENIYNTKLSSEGIILIGSESHGINESLIPFITTKVSIPSFSGSSSKQADSLNAAMAAAIVCSEFRRR